MSNITTIVWIWPKMFFRCTASTLKAASWSRYLRRCGRPLSPRSCQRRPARGQIVRRARRARPPVQVPNQPEQDLIGLDQFLAFGDQRVDVGIRNGEASRDRL